MLAHPCTRFKTASPRAGLVGSIFLTCSASKVSKRYAYIPLKYVLKVARPACLFENCDRLGVALHSRLKLQATGGDITGSESDNIMRQRSQPASFISQDQILSDQEKCANKQSMSSESMKKHIINICKDAETSSAIPNGRSQSTSWLAFLLKPKAVGFVSLSLIGLAASLFNRSSKAHVQNHFMSAAILSSEAPVEKKFKALPPVKEDWTVKNHDSNVYFHTPGGPHAQPTRKNVMIKSGQTFNPGESTLQLEGVNELPHVPRHKSPTWTWGRVICSSVWKSLVDDEFYIVAPRVQAKGSNPLPPSVPSSESHTVEEDVDAVDSTCYSDGHANYDHDENNHDDSQNTDGVMDHQDFTYSSAKDNAAQETSAQGSTVFILPATAVFLAAMTVIIVKEASGALQGKNSSRDSNSIEDAEHNTESIMKDPLPSSLLMPASYVDDALKEPLPNSVLMPACNVESDVKDTFISTSLMPVTDIRSAVKEPLPSSPLTYNLDGLSTAQHPLLFNPFSCSIVKAGQTHQCDITDSISLDQLEECFHSFCAVYKAANFDIFGRSSVAFAVERYGKACKRALFQHIDTAVQDRVSQIRATDTEEGWSMTLCPLNSFKSKLQESLYPSWKLLCATLSAQGDATDPSHLRENFSVEKAVSKAGKVIAFKGQQPQILNPVIDMALHKCLLIWISSAGESNISGASQKTLLSSVAYIVEKAISCIMDTLKDKAIAKKARSLSKLFGNMESRRDINFSFSRVEAVERLMEYMDSAQFTSDELDQLNQLSPSVHKLCSQKTTFPPLDAKLMADVRGIIKHTILHQLRREGHYQIFQQPASCSLLTQLDSWNMWDAHEHGGCVSSALRCLINRKLVEGLHDYRLVLDRYQIEEDALSGDSFPEETKAVLTLWLHVQCASGMR
ncbi:hypothetical protein CEUSTIGMA_g13229.t1 [Chlamydomonas eustigma]|uniref:Uncharacterized protein n=1 Tax=Chlamydomonas eustigma TaxID=1157962 RepID=A0A250XRY3_9CHLO|nr:hypothetical protein CEUSTIGMA_g13229.t1 [Chlamydomonas eustigma]|eukprot:GAX85814.1 hypothetical protein CEUSTIGMA_g13229.t1 [Chlamydomonas eustigma]